MEKLYRYAFASFLLAFVANKLFSVDLGGLVLGSAIVNFFGWMYERYLKKPEEPPKDSFGNVL